LIPVSLILSLVVVMSNCKDEEKNCECCVGFGNTEKVVNGNKLIIYSAFTPSNLKYCDSIVLDTNGIPIETSKYCRPNPDSIYNDTINEYFYIDGIEAFPENDLIIRVPGDTTKIDRFVNYSNSTSGQRVFQGTRTDTTLYGSERTRNLTSRKFEFVLQLYSSKDHIKANRIDSLQGYFCIIRTSSFKNTGCQGKMTNDPLIK